jgi:acyl-CoA synthetase (AMP-forming)/AMP-acid ligase II
MPLHFGQYELTLGEAARRAAESAPQRVVCRREDKQLTLAALDVQANRLANALIARGFKPADRAALLMSSEPEFLIALVAITRAGGVSQVLMPQYGGAELARLLHLAPPRWLFYAAAHRADAASIIAEHDPVTIILENVSGASLQWSALVTEGEPCPPGVAVAPGDDAMILFTSGTTGDPKAVMRSQNSLVSHGVLYNHYLKAGGDSVSAAMQFDYEAPARLLADGGCFVIANALNPREWLGAIERERVTHTGGVTSLLQLWFSYARWSDFDLSSLRCVAVGAMGTPAEIQHLARQRLGFPLVQMYGSIEAGILAVNEASNGRQPGALGRPVEGKEIRIIDEQGDAVPVGGVGEMVARPTGDYELGFAKGYCGTSQTPWVDGWLHTGDLAYQDEDGYLYFVGRTIDTINMAGHKVYAAEVERALLGHPDVAEAAVIGQPDDRHGEIVVAFAVLTSQQQTTVSDLRAHCSAHLALHKVPKRLILLDDLPRTATGKVSKQLLSKQLG